MTARVRANRFCSSTRRPDGSRTPLELVTVAREELEAFGKRLMKVQDTVKETPRFGQTVMQCRDASMETFAHPSSVEARDSVFATATQLEAELREMCVDYSDKLTPLMEQAAKLCTETPCGGLSWEMSDEQWDALTSRGSSHRSAGKVTPCGLMFAASNTFIGITLSTRDEVDIASRAAIFLRMSRDFGKPLKLVRQGDQRKEMAKIFQSQFQPAPWIRSQEEYDKFAYLKNDLDKSDRFV